MFEDDPAEDPELAPLEASEPGPVADVPAANPAPSEEAAIEAYQQRARLAEDRLAEVLAAYREFKRETEASKERVTRQLHRKFEHRHDSLLLKFIDILDNFDRALEAAQTAGDSLIEGLILVRTQLLQMLQDEGLERIPVLGLPFDPHVAEAVGVVPVDDPDHHHVAMKEMLRGYRLNGRIARPSRVMIGEYKETQPEVAPTPAHDPLLAVTEAAAAAALAVSVEPEIEAEPETDLASELESELAAPPETEHEIDADVESVLAPHTDPDAPQISEPDLGLAPELGLGGDLGLSLDEIIARAEAQDAEDEPAAEPEPPAILYHDLTEIGEAGLEPLEALVPAADPDEVEILDPDADDSIDPSDWTKD